MPASRSTIALAVVALLLLAGCATVPEPAARRDRADALAAAKGWRATVLDTGGMRLVAWFPAQPRPTGEAPLTVYLEGDGLAWRTVSMPSADPTPITPVGLQLALAQPSGPVAYLARPCQYIDAGTNACPSRYWLDARYGREVVMAMGNALDQLKIRHAAQQLVLVGFSGGGTLAALLAAERADVLTLITVAGNLDTGAFTAHHAISPLHESFDPAQTPAAWRRLPQWHVVGERDKVVPPVLTRDLLVRLAPPNANVLSVAQADHNCCWETQWPTIWQKISSALNADLLKDQH